MQTTMKEFTETVAGVRDQCDSLSEGLAKLHKLSAQAPPIEALPMAFNFSTLALELTSHYVATWGVHPVANLKAENADRLVMLSKTTFVWSLSAMAFAAKGAIAAYSGVLSPKKGKRLYLHGVVEMSAGAGLIDAVKRPLWLGVNTVRNMLVHNNGYGDVKNSWKFTKDLIVTMEVGKMIRGNITTFPRLLSWTVAEYADWCDRFLKKAIPSP